MSVGALYDRLLQFEGRNAHTSYPVHKRLTPPYGVNWLVDLIHDRIDLPEQGQVLDAGCGNGHTLQQLAKLQPIQGLGVSLSEQEIGRAQETTQAAGVSFVRQSYDADFPMKFDLIVACESLRHSPDLSATLNHWMEALNPGGKIFIADDFLPPNTELTPALVRHQHYWEAPQFFSLEQLLGHLPPAVHYERIDLTHAVPTRSRSTLRILTSLLPGLLPVVRGKYRKLLEVYLGGLLLEKGYADLQLMYQAVIIQNQK